MNRILSTAIAAAIAITSLGTALPAMSAPLAPAPLLAADSPLVPVHHKKGHKGKWGKGKWSKGPGLYLNFGPAFGFGYPAWCFEKRRVWIPGLGLRWRTVNICE